MTFIELFGTFEDKAALNSQNDNNELSSILSIRYPKVKVTNHFKNEMESHLDMRKSNSQIFRRLIGNLIPNKYDWALRNSKQMLLNFNDEISAAFGNLSIIFNF